MLKKLFIFLISFSLLLSCTNSPSVKQSENKIKGIQIQIDVPLNRKTVLSGKATMLIPGAFKMMSARMLASKYQKIGHQPTEVYTNETGTINVALNHTQNKADEKDLPSVKKIMESQFNQPSVKFIRSSMQEINYRKYIRLEFVTSATDSEIYNLLQITSFEGRLTMFTFNCTENYRKDWERFGKEIMQSIVMK